MPVKVFNQTGEAAGTVELPKAIFAVSHAKPEVVHQVVVAASANQRNTVAATKTRGEVRGGGRKPWRQKGTGRARAGSIRSPLWRGGGITFGPRPARNFRKQVNKKTRRLALLSALSDRAMNQRVLILTQLESSGKTKELALRLHQLREKFNWLGKRVLLITPALKTSEKLAYAAKNLPDLTVLPANSLNILEVLRADSLIILQDALAIIDKIYGTAR